MRSKSCGGERSSAYSETSYLTHMTLTSPKVNTELLRGQLSKYVAEIDDKELIEFALRIGFIEDSTVPDRLIVDSPAQLAKEVEERQLKRKRTYTLTEAFAKIVEGAV